LIVKYPEAAGKYIYTANPVECSYSSFKKIRIKKDIFLINGYLTSISDKK